MHDFWDTVVETSRLSRGSCMELRPSSSTQDILIHNPPADTDCAHLSENLNSRKVVKHVLGPHMRCVFRPLWWPHISGLMVSEAECAGSGEETAAYSVTPTFTRQDFVYVFENHLNVAAHQVKRFYSVFESVDFEQDLRNFAHIAVTTSKDGAPLFTCADDDELQLRSGRTFQPACVGFIDRTSFGFGPPPSHGLDGDPAANIDLMRGLPHVASGHGVESDGKVSPLPDAECWTLRAVRAMYAALLVEGASPEEEVSSNDVEDAPDYLNVFLGTLALMQVGVVESDGGSSFVLDPDVGGARRRLNVSNNAVRAQRLHL